MNRLLTLSALFGLAMTGAAAAQTEVAISPDNGTCPSGFELRSSSSGADDLCVQTVTGMSGSGNISLATFSSGGDDDGDHGHGDHDSDSD
jgi:hypothetical protein